MHFRVVFRCICAFLGSLYPAVKAEWTHTEDTVRGSHSVTRIVFPPLIRKNCGLDWRLQKDGFSWIKRNKFWPVLNWFVLASWLISHKFWITLYFLPPSKSGLSYRAEWHNETHSIPCSNLCSKNQSNCCQFDQHSQPAICRGESISWQDCVCKAYCF